MQNLTAIEIAPDARKRAIASIRRYFAEELDQDVGDLKAGLLLDYFVAELAPLIYNHAIADAKAFFEERSADLAAVCYRAEFPFWEQKRDATKPPASARQLNRPSGSPTTVPS